MIRNIFLLFLWVYSCSTADVKSRYYPRYHLAPPNGWMNDPNGFSIFKGEYHLFYQYDPDSSHKAGSIHWGHAKSTDLMNWEHLPIAMYPDQSYDSGGVFSGSAIIEDDTMYLYYTAHVNHPGESPDHEESQALATSTDGVNVTKYANNPIIVRSDLQPDIRDPKVWKHGDTYYMVLGHSINGTTGSILLFTSQDKYKWEQASVLAVSNGTLGYMFECPDFFEVDGRFVLLFSPQGIEAQGDDYKNLYQTAYIVGSFDYETNQFTQETALKELDHGHDIYATQTIDDNGRRVVIAWMDMWSTGYPEQDDGFNGCMTLPRVLSLDKDGTLIQKPIQQVKKSRDQVVYSGTAKADKPIILNDKAGEISIRSRCKTNLEVSIGVEGNSNSTSKVTLTYDPKEGTVTLDRGGEDGIRRTHWKPKKHRDLNWRIFVDASSIELFCGRGEVTFTSRFFLDGPLEIRVKSSKKASVKVTSLRRTVPVPSDD